MSAFDIGSICIKKVGKDAGKKCVIVDFIDKSFVLITGPKALSGVSRRKVNLRHVEASGYEVKITRGASDKDVIDAINVAGKTADMAVKVKVKA